MTMTMEEHSHNAAGRTLMERLVAGITLFIAFLVMASIFVPAPSRAGHGEAPPATHEESADAHQGLRSIGVLEDVSYAIEMFSTSQGTRYTVREQGTGSELGALLSLEQLRQGFPDVDLSRLHGSGETLDRIMLAEPEWP